MSVVALFFVVRAERADTLAPVCSRMRHGSSLHIGHMHRLPGETLAQSGGVAPLKWPTR